MKRIAVARGLRRSRSRARRPAPPASGRSAPRRRRPAPCRRRRRRARSRDACRSAAICSRRKSARLMRELDLGFDHPAVDANIDPARGHAMSSALRRHRVSARRVTTPAMWRRYSADTCTSLIGIEATRLFRPRPDASSSSVPPRATPFRFAPDGPAMARHRTRRWRRGGRCGPRRNRAGRSTGDGEIAMAAGISVEAVAMATRPAPPADRAQDLALVECGLQIAQQYVDVLPAPQLSVTYCCLRHSACRSSSRRSHFRQSA